MQRWQFSLRSLLIAVTALPVLISSTLKYPGVALILALFGTPFLWVATRTHLIHTPRFGRIAMVLCGSVVVLAGGQLFVLANRNHEMDLQRFFSFAFLCGYGLFYAVVACGIPDEAP